MVKQGGQGAVEQVTDQRQVAAAVRQYGLNPAYAIDALQAPADTGLVAQHGNLTPVGVGGVERFDTDFGVVAQAAGVVGRPACLAP